MDNKKAALILLQDNLILVDDTNVKQGDICFSKEYEEVFEIFDIEEIKGIHLKVIAQQPQIKLLKEVAEQIGWIDVKRISNIATENYYQNSDNKEYCEYQTFQIGFNKGFQTHRELNKNKYSEEDLIKAIDMAKERHHINCLGEEFLYSQNNIIESINQPKQYQVEYTEENGIFNITKIIK